MVFTVQTKLSCEQIENQIEEDSDKFNLLLKKHFAFSNKLPNINNYASVFELCNMKLAAKLLNTQNNLSILMPCRINVYEQDGKSYAATPDLTIMLSSFDIKDEELKKDILDLYNEITTMLKSW